MSTCDDGTQIVAGAQKASAIGGTLIVICCDVLIASLHLRINVHSIPSRSWSLQYNMSTIRTNKRLSLREVELNGWLLILHIILETCIIWNSCTSFIWVFYFISIFLDWRLGFEPTLQLKGLSLSHSPSKSKFIWGPQSSTLVGSETIALCCCKF